MNEETKDRLIAQISALETLVVSVIRALPHHQQAIREGFQMGAEVARVTLLNSDETDQARHFHDQYLQRLNAMLNSAADTR